jgi:hypothetical protein
LIGGVSAPLKLVKSAFVGSIKDIACESTGTFEQMRSYPSTERAALGSPDDFVFIFVCTHVMEQTL